VRNQIPKILLQALALDARPALDHREDAVPEGLVIYHLDPLYDLVLTRLMGPLKSLELARSEPQFEFVGPLRARFERLVQECALVAGLAADDVLVSLALLLQLDARLRLVSFRRLLREVQRLKLGVLDSDAHILTLLRGQDGAALHIHAWVRSVE